MRGVESHILREHGVFAFFSTERKEIDFKTHYNYSLKIVAPLLGSKKLVLAEQVHGRKIKFVQKTRRVMQGVDGLITKRRDVVLGIVTADCFPVLMYDREGQIIAAIHCGWRGVYKGVIDEALKYLNPEHTVVSIGPGICGRCYEVSGDLFEKFKKRFPASLFDLRNHLDLRKIIQYQLEEAGVKKENIENIDLCTFENPDILFSYRRGDVYLRNLNIISFTS